MKNILVKTLLTTNILVELPDKTLSTNNLGEMAQFIGTATAIDNDEKQCGLLRFESKPFELEKISDIHSAWLNFQHTIEEYCNKTPDCFGALSPKVVRL